MRQDNEQSGIIISEGLIFIVHLSVWPRTDKKDIEAHRK